MNNGKWKDVNLDEVKALAAQGLNNEQIYLTLDISSATYYDWVNKHPEFIEAIKNGRAKGVAKISNSLFQSAKNGNVTAQIFFLKNRSPDEWADVQKNEHTGNLEISEVVRKIVTE